MSDIPAAKQKDISESSDTSCSKDHALFGGKNSKDHHGLPLFSAAASLSEIFIVAGLCYMQCSDGPSEVFVTRSGPRLLDIRCYTLCFCCSDPVLQPSIRLAFLQDRFLNEDRWRFAGS